MFAQIMGSTTMGLNGILITVEVDIANGIPCLDIVGLPDTAVRESRERVRAAIKNSGFEFPTRRITVNLAPADIKKESSGLDLPIAVGILAASGQILVNYQSQVFAGELSLEGRLRAVSGILSMAANCQDNAISEMFVAPENAQEALLAGSLKVYAPETLAEIVKHLNAQRLLSPVVSKMPERQTIDSTLDFADVQGQVVAKRALEIAAAGFHNVMMVGPPGSGKTMLAKRIPSILPAMTSQEALEVTKIYSVAGMLKNNIGLVTERPFRSPHHTVSMAGMIGGGSMPRPGEVTLSHNGVLFLDELPEFPRTVLEVLRQPLEDGEVTISRVNATLSYPAKLMLIAALNPCPCGFSSDPSRECTCTPNDIRRYQKKISGPLLDRLDITIHVPRLEYNDLVKNVPQESSSVIRSRVENARLIQEERLLKFGFHANAQMEHKHIKKLCKLTPDAIDLLRQAFSRMNLSARGYDRIIKVAQTIADLSGKLQIEVEHIAEAIQFRNDFQIISRK
ncbi:YifB family Mg chelatase-like AAA ATPase [Sporomusa acidovorans]|uniref:Competence protein ComM n=1 Tax=Sporomusa acidovorans (strain ATCC 49682 / DSM 3132 / Mol) TaxID=1123286 RepID=A0ABZ3J2S3_SPOA4|nr:YifB family Mg chelatase-like AAA ATPase [Sporomusa acidovorans]OZC20042.1 competence protein ComM [Sporomusa acidovorans DSM 3132]SDD46752.1 magnesium chelatase family protein [Sporomusa acidovorans]